MTVRKSKSSGLHGHDGMDFICINMNFTECDSGVCAGHTCGKLIDCQVTKCVNGGIFCNAYGWIEVFGERTKVSGNCTNGKSGCYGLCAHGSSSKIVFHSPLTKELVSTNNGGGGNWATRGCCVVS